MVFTVTFLGNLGAMLLDGAPLFLALALIIASLAVFVGRREGWSVGDSLYFGFITALTVGYGDMRPSYGLGKFLAIVIALVGMITTGIVVALAVESTSLSWDELYGT